MVLPAICFQPNSPIYTMKKLQLLFLAALLFQSTFSQKLIVRGDDMGFSHSGNLALIEACNQGIQTSVEVIVPASWFPEAVRLLQQNAEIDVGIHLTLTSEWDHIKWPPLTDSPSLKDEDGYFYPMIWPNENYPGRALKEKSLNLKEIENEWRAQIEKGLRYIPRISHISGHMGCTHMTEETKQLATRLAREYNIDIDPAAYGVQGIGYKGKHGTFQEKKESFLKMLDGLHPDSTYLFVEHPGLDTPELRAIHHIGYENVAADRQGVTDLWTDPEVISFIRKKGILLMSYKDLVE